MLLARFSLRFFHFICKKKENQQIPAGRAFSPNRAASSARLFLRSDTAFQTKARSEGRVGGRPGYLHRKRKQDTLFLCAVGEAPEFSELFRERFQGGLPGLGRRAPRPYFINDASDKPLSMFSEKVSSVGLFSRSSCGETGEKHARRACTLLAGGHARRGKSS